MATRTYHMTWLATAVLSLGISGVASAESVLSPYSHSFDDDTAGKLTLTSNLSPSNWYLRNKELDYTRVLRDSDQHHSASVQILKAGTGTASFKVTLKVAPAMDYSSGAISLHARASSLDLGGAWLDNEMGYRAEIWVGFDEKQVYKLRLYRGAKQLGPDTVITFNPSANQMIHTFSLEGMPQANGELKLTSRLSDGKMHSATASFTEAAADVLKTGTYFGFKARITGSHNSLGARFDDFSVSAPLAASSSNTR